MDGYKIQDEKQKQLLTGMGKGKDEEEKERLVGSLMFLKNGQRRMSK